MCRGDCARSLASLNHGQAALNRMRQWINPLTYEELIVITTTWIYATLQLSERDLWVIGRQDRVFVAMQSMEASGCHESARFPIQPLLLLPINIGRP